MRKCRTAIVLAAIVLLGTTELSAQARDAAAIKNVQAQEQARVDALLRGDPEAAEAIYAEDYTLVTERGAIQSKAFRIDALRSGRLKFEKIEIEERTYRVYDDTVVILSREKLTIRLNGQPAGGDLRVTRVYKLIGGQWKAIASHASAVK